MSSISFNASHLKCRTRWWKRNLFLIQMPSLITAGEMPKKLLLSGQTASWLRVKPSTYWFNFSTRQACKRCHLSKARSYQRWFDSKQQSPDSSCGAYNCTMNNESVFFSRVAIRSVINASLNLSFACLSWRRRQNFNRLSRNGQIAQRASKMWEESFALYWVADDNKNLLNMPFRPKINNGQITAIRRG